MLNKKNKPLLVLIMIFVFFSGCTKNDQTKKVQNENSKKQEASLTVFTSILPQKYFVERIGGNRVVVEVLVSPGKSPSTFEPSPRQILDLGNADIFFTIGVPFEITFLPQIKDSFPGLKIVDTSAGIEKRFLETHSHEEDDEEGEDHSENHKENNKEDEKNKVNDRNAPRDPHIWLSPELVKIQAEHILKALVEADPQGEEEYRERYRGFIEDLDNLDKELAAALAPFKGNTLFVFHPAFGYFADRYGLKQMAVETGGKEPSPAVLEEIIEHAIEEDVKIIFVQPEFSVESARAVADAIDGVVVTLNPLDPDYINNLKSIADEIEKAFVKK